jgi:hypothetical protein
LYWYDADGKRYLTPEEQVKESAQRAQQESQRAQQESQRADQLAQRSDLLAQRLRELGIDPENLS